MKPTITLQLPPILINKIINKVSGYKDSIYEFLDSNDDLTSMFYGCYDFFKDIRGEVISVQIDKDNFFMDKNNGGSFHANLNIEYNYGCDDLDEQDDDSMEMIFTILPQTGEILIEGEEIPERDDQN